MVDSKVAEFTIKVVDDIIFSPNLDNSLYPHHVDDSHKSEERRIEPKLVRSFIILIGLSMTIYFFIKTD